MPRKPPAIASIITPLSASPLAAESAGAAYWPVLVIGNAAIVALEGLVVGIQTTRLILFEFFIRFLTAQGRPFEPLPPLPTDTDPLPRSKP